MNEMSNIKTEVAAERGLSLGRYSDACERFELHLQERIERERSALREATGDAGSGHRIALNELTITLDTFRAMLNGDA